MAYTKQTWTNDVTAITAERMTHIEQGIYDNSLATDKINPSGTATTTAEIEEEQVNDVIGFKSLKLKGQTSQYTTDGYNKLAVNTGSDGVTLVNNEYYITNVNQCNVVKTGVTLTANTAHYLKFKLLSRPTTSTSFTAYLDGTHETTLDFANINSAGNYNLNQVYTKTITPSANTALTIIQYGNSNGEKFQFQLWLTTDNAKNTFEPYTNGASPNPDFPQEVNNVSGNNVITISNKNIFDKDDSNSIFSGFPNGATNKLQSNANAKTAFIPCKPSTKYTVSKTSSARFIVADTSSNNIVGDIDVTMLATATNVGSHTVTTSANAKYLLAFYYLSTADTKTEQEIRNSLQIEQSNSATTYTAHQGNNFEIDLPVENKLPYPYVDTTKTNNGITYTDLGDGRIKVNGTATANSAFALYGTASSQIALNANYVYGGVNSNVRVRVMNRSSGGTYTTLGNSIGTSTKIDRSTISTGYVEISIASGTTVNNLIITPMLSDNEVNAFTPYNENPIKLCKIGTYQDYIYKKDGKWWKHTEFEKLTLKDMNWFLADNTGLSNTVSHRWAINHPCSRISNNNMQVTMSNILPMGSANITWGQDVLSIGQSVSQVVIRMPVEYTTAEAMKTALAETNAVGYALLGTPIEEEITYTPLIRQLDELYNSGLYDVTNISQDNSSEAFILDLEACKNNINGIVEYIRR